jgi:DNA-binding transcriptional regulator YdaS (Cro superfamily)
MTEKSDKNAPTPLGEYLERRGIASKDLGDELAQILGYTPSSGSLSQWRTGRSAPGPAVQLALSEVTDGEVTPIDWAQWQVSRGV